MENTKRLTREEIREPDQVTTVLDHAFVWVQKHPSRIAGVAVGLILVGLIAAVVTSWSRSRDANASKALAAVVELANRRVGAAPADPNERGPKAKLSFPDAAARDNAIILEAEAMIAAHGASRAARGAQMLKAQALSRRGRYKDAVDLFGQVAGSAPTDALGGSAAIARALARAGLGETDAAVEDLKRLAAAGNPHVPRDLALHSAADLVERSGQHDIAAKLYQRIIDETPDSSLVAEARSRVQELSTKKAAARP